MLRARSGIRRSRHRLLQRLPQQGTAPTISFSGPTTLAAGATATYTVTVTGGTRVGVNIASSDTFSALNAMGSNLDVAFGELHHTSPQPSGTAFSSR